MASINRNSKFEYDTIPFQDFAMLGEPVVHIVEMNDGYGFLGSGPGISKLHDSDTQHDRGGIQCNHYSSFREWLLEEGGAEEDEDGNLIGGTYVDGKEVELTIEDHLKQLTEGASTSDGMMIVAGVMHATKLTGSYRDPETLFDAFFGGDGDDEDEDEDDCED